MTELAEFGLGDEVIMSIAGHVSRAMRSRYSHVRMEAKRRALDEIAVRQCAADEKHLKEAEQKQQTPMASLRTKGAVAGRRGNGDPGQSIPRAGVRATM